MEYHHYSTMTLQMNTPSSNEGVKEETKTETRQQQQQNDRKTLVRFPDLEEDLVTVVEEILNREDLTEEDCARLWFSTEDYAVLKQETRLDCLESDRQSQDGGLLQGVFAEKSREVQEKLNRWAIDCPGKRGLEKTVCQSLGDARQAAQFQAVMDVLRYQDEMLIDKGKVDAEEVRKVSLKATKTARHFARMIGKADAVAIDADMGESMRDLGFGESLRDFSFHDRERDRDKRHSNGTSRKKGPSKHKSHSPIRNPIKHSKNGHDSLLGTLGPYHLESLDNLDKKSLENMDKKEKKKLVKTVTKMIEKEVKLKVKEEKQKAKEEKHKLKEIQKEEKHKAKQKAKEEKILKAKEEKEEKVKAKDANTKRKEKKPKPKLKVEDPTPKEEKLKEREERIEATETPVDEKNMTQTLKQKFMDTKAGIIARIPRIR